MFNLIEKGKRDAEQSAGFFVSYKVGGGVEDSLNGLALNVCELQGLNAKDLGLIRVVQGDTEILLLTGQRLQIVGMGGGNDMIFLERFFPQQSLQLGNLRIRFGQDKGLGVCVVDTNGRSWSKISFAEPVTLKGVLVVSGGQTFSLSED